MKLDLYLTLHTKTDSEGIEDGEWGLTGQPVGQRGTPASQVCEGLLFKTYKELITRQQENKNKQPKNP